jgi:tryptophan synthase alpha chain
MSRLDSTFARLRQDRHTGLVTYVTAGDPDLARSGAILRALDGAGADVLEVGVPFSDPLADGPVIQRASERALRQGTTLAGVLQLIADLRSTLLAPVVLFSYVNPIVRMGVEPFAREAAGAGVDGVLALDLPADEADALRDGLGRHGVDTIFLLSPTSTASRIRRAAALGRGFLYGVSRLGVTGARAALADAARPLVQRIREVSALPVAVGFGVSRPDHVREIGTFADAAVVGSALVSVVEESAEQDDLAARVAERVRWLKGIDELAVDS